MSSTTEPKNEGWSGGGRHHGPPSEEQRQKFEAEFKQEFFDEYRKRHGDALISAEQTWELYKAVEEGWHTKMKARRHEHHSPPPHGHGPPPHRRSPSPGHFEEARKRILDELQQEFQKDFATAYNATGKVNAEQAWSLIQKVQQSKHEKWEANRPKHGPGHGPGHGRGHGHGPGHGPRHGPGCHGRHSPPSDH